MKIPNLNRDPTGQTYLLQKGLIAVGFEIKADNWRGPKTERALTLYQAGLEPELEDDWDSVKASSFADPADVLAFRRCKEQGHSDMYCFGKGDNGIGAWGHNTAQTDTPMAALPREIWRNAGKTGGAKIQVRYGGIIVDGILGDTMPSLANIRNGAGIDLNPAFAEKFGLNPPFLVQVEWRWLS